MCKYANVQVWKCANVKMCNCENSSTKYEGRSTNQFANVRMCGFRYGIRMTKYEPICEFADVRIQVRNTNDEVRTNLRMCGCADWGTKYEGRSTNQFANCGCADSSTKYEVRSTNVKDKSWRLKRFAASLRLCERIFRRSSEAQRFTK